MKKFTDFDRFLKVAVTKQPQNNEMAHCEVLAIAPIKPLAKKNAYSLKKDYLDYRDMIDELVENEEISGKEGLCFVRFSGMRCGMHVLVVGIGVDKEDVNALGKTERLRRLGASVMNRLSIEKIKSAAVYLDTFLNRDGGLDTNANEDISQAAYAFIEGMALASYKFDKYLSINKSKNKKKKPLEVHLIAHDREQALKYAKGVAKALAYFTGTLICRDLSNEPSNELTPMLYAKCVTGLAKKHGLKCAVYDEKWIKKQGMGLLYGVGQGSVNPPRLIVVTYKPRDKGSQIKKSIAFVGKGVTFDSGGISIKPSAKMEEMKHDMSGSAAVIGAIITSAMLKLPIHATAVLTCAENMPDARAIQPGNILKARNGKTVEVTNTDAEGRLVLADALDFVQTDLKPDYIIDLATLTGAATITFGKACCGLMGNDAIFNKLCKEAASASGERVWELPLFEEYFEDLKSSCADMRNAGDTPANGTAKGAMFLFQFIKNDSKWIHLDIASVANGVSGIPYYGKGSTGYGVRLLVELAKRCCSSLN